jgi:hypothetical protein
VLRPARPRCIPYAITFWGVEHTSHRHTHIDIDIDADVKECDVVMGIYQILGMCEVGREA